LIFVFFTFDEKSYSSKGLTADRKLVSEHKAVGKKPFAGRKHLNFDF